ncbi:NAD(P)H-dependent oxidoreductase [Staphylococcus gallinarum]|uniref:NAD(P)H-dependent oxidoreductase n=1 Tax=Staphylococcus gallinarum TaxID=1293 RepID=UPI001E39940F|nr:NAD(P)H-dependent oxidoreductase [Staphylococcus gallinarum]MCD8871042.1 NAD(P)H-dependent oxidoreductase [Staphylococcus gallinarum]MCW0985701.1 NAD(P)H-dependent oxidoreductase [Staphylococcus gallinarum]
MTHMQDTIIEAFNFRHATKRFDATKSISDSEFNTILESGRLSPSSLGLEPWKFVVIQNKALRNKLKEISWGAQGQLDTASYFVLILARKNVVAKSPYVQHLLREVKQYSPESIPATEEKFDSFQTGFHINDNERTLLDWARKQTYIALGNMMTSAALLNIDSCPIEGFDLDGVTKLLSDEGILDEANFAPSVMVAFGYRETEPKPKVRQSQADVIEWLE